MKIPEEYGGLGLIAGLLQPGAGAGGTWHSSLVDAALRPPVDRRRRAAAAASAPRSRSASGCRRSPRTHISRLPAHRARRRLGPGADGRDRAIPTEDGTGYVLNGRKLWATNGAIADVVVVMAAVPKREGHRGGITAFIVPVRHRRHHGRAPQRVHGPARHRELGHRASRTSSCPSENLIGERGPGPEDRPDDAEHRPPRRCRRSASAPPSARTKIAREWAGRARAVGPAGRQARRGRPEDRVHRRARRSASRRCSTSPAAWPTTSATTSASRRRIAKLYASEMGWQVVDELMQIRGGRGYETAESLQARGEKPVPVEQMLRDMRINRIFEGSTEIMHLLIAREAVDQHLAGRRRHPRARRRRLKDEGQGRPSRPASSTPSGCRSSRSARARSPARSPSSARWPAHLRFVERASRKLARSTFYAMGRWQAGLEKKQAVLGRIVDIGAELFAIAVAPCVYADTIADERPERARARRSSWPTCSAARPAAASTRCSPSCGRNDDDAGLRGGPGGARRPLHLARGGRRSTRRATGRRSPVSPRAEPPAPARSSRAPSGRSAPRRSPASGRIGSGGSTTDGEHRHAAAQRPEAVAVRRVVAVVAPDPAQARRAGRALGAQPRTSASWSGRAAVAGLLAGVDHELLPDARGRARTSAARRARRRARRRACSTRTRSSVASGRASRRASSGRRGRDAVGVADAR